MFLFFELPLELKLYIVSFLDIQERFQLRVVCRRWRDILFHPFILRHIAFRYAYNPYKLCACLNFAEQVVTLDIFSCILSPMGGFSPQSLTFPGIFRTLKRLYVRQTDVCSATICEILEETTCLEVLDVTLSDATDAICDHICKYARTLRVLKFTTDYEVPLPWSKEKISAVLQCCGSLHTLGIGGEAPLDISQMRELLSGSVCKQLSTIMCYEVSDSFLTNVFKESIQVSPTSRPRLCICDSLITLKDSSKELFEKFEVFKCKHL